MATQLKPFREGTRQRIQKVGTIAYAAASALNPLELPRVGMLNRIIVQFRGTVTLSGAGALSDLGPWNLLSRLKVMANLGSASIVDLTGYGAYLMQAVCEEMGYRPDLGGVGASSAFGDLHAAPVAAGANAWVLTWVLPVGANPGAQFDVGMINLQAPEVRVTTELTTGQVTDPAALATGITGNFHVYYEYFEIPDPSQYELPRLALVRWIEEQQAIGATGDNIYTIPRQGVLTNLIHRVSINSVRSDAIDSLALKFNKTDTPYAMERQLARIYERIRYGLNPITGVFVHDLWHATSDVSAGDLRDAIDTEELSTVESYVTITAGTGLGAAGTNVLASIRRIIQVLD